MQVWGAAKRSPRCVRIADSEIQRRSHLPEPFMQLNITSAGTRMALPLHTNFSGSQTQAVSISGLSFPFCLRPSVSLFLSQWPSLVRNKKFSEYILGESREAIESKANSKKGNECIYIYIYIYIYMHQERSASCISIRLSHS
jgi:hypothetical protein